MNVLGISSYYHDSAAAIIMDGQVIAAYQEERFTRIKHDPSFPSQAIQACLNKAGIGIIDVQKVVFYEKPFWKFERILDTITQNIPYSFLQFAKAIPLWVKNRLWISTDINKKLNYKGTLLFASHHQSHAASAFFSSPFSEAAIITLDGVGEYATSTIGFAQQQKIEIIREQKFPHSLGLLYSAFTQYCGFKVNSGEYKLMGLAPYGKAIYKSLIYENLIAVFDDGSYSLNRKYFAFETGSKMINQKFELLFGKSARKMESEMTEFYMDVAASIQEVIEEVTIKIVKNAKTLTNQKNAVFAGGVFLNCKLNQRIVEANIFEECYFDSNPSDAGAAVGAAFLGYYDDHSTMQQPLKSTEGSVNRFHSTEIEIVSKLKQMEVPYEVLDLPYKSVAQELSNGKIVAWYNGEMEFGPRALGNRSILAHPGNAKMKSILNEKIKLRESFRPFAPAVLADHAEELFELGNANYETMMVTAQAKAGTKEMMPAVIHEDGTARLQTVTSEDNEAFYRLIKAFYHLTKCPALINTSFNLRGEPIVASIEDALHTFLYTEIDILVFDAKYVIDKSMDLTAIKKIIQQKSFAND